MNHSVYAFAMYMGGYTPFWTRKSWHLTSDRTKKLLKNNYGDVSHVFIKISIGKVTSKYEGFVLSLALFLEIFGLRGWKFLKPCPEARKRLDSVMRGFDLGGRDWASPIREIDAGLRADLSVSNEMCEESRIKDQRSELLQENHDIGKIWRKSRLGSSGDSKAKKLLRKFILRKFQRVREVGRGPPCVEVTEENLSEADLLEKKEEKADSSGDEVNIFRTCDGDLGDGEDTYRTHINTDENESARSYQFVFFLIVLCGLVKGKIVALLLAMA